MKEISSRNNEGFDRKNHPPENTPEYDVWIKKISLIGKVEGFYINCINAVKNKNEDPNNLENQFKELQGLLLEAKSIGLIYGDFYFKDPNKSDPKVKITEANIANLRKEVLSINPDYRDYGPEDVKKNARLALEIEMMQKPFLITSIKGSYSEFLALKNQMENIRNGINPYEKEKSIDHPERGWTIKEAKISTYNSLKMMFNTFNLYLNKAIQKGINYDEFTFVKNDSKIKITEQTLQEMKTYMEELNKDPELKQ